MTRIQRDIEKFKTCSDCGGTNTEPILLSDQYARIVFTGWCRSCKDHYSYSTWVEVVWDKERRI